MIEHPQNLHTTPSPLNGRIRGILVEQKAFFEAAIESFQDSRLASGEDRTADSSHLEGLLAFLIEKTWVPVGGTPKAGQTALREEYLGDLKEFLFEESGLNMAASIRRLLILGLLHWRQNSFEKAQEITRLALSAAATLNDEQLLAESYITHGLIQAGLDHPGEAVAAYEMVTQLLPVVRVPWNNLGNLYARLCLYEKAVESFQKALEVDGLDPVSLQGLGACYSAMGLKEDTLDAFSVTITDEPDMAAAWKSLGVSCAQSQRILDALKAFSRALELDPAQPAVWLEKARLEETMAHYDQAAAAYQHVLGLDEARADVWILLGNAHFKAGMYVEAVKAYYQAVSQDSSSGWGYSNMALAYTQMGQFSQAGVLFQKGIQVFLDGFDKANALVKLGYVYRNQGRDVKATQAFLQAESYARGSTEFSRYHLLPGPFNAPHPGGNGSGMRPASFWGASPDVGDNDLPSQLPGAARGSNFYPSSAEPVDGPASEAENANRSDIQSRTLRYWINQGNLHLGAGNLDQAIQNFEIALELDPLNGWIYGNLATVYVYKGAYHEAIPLYERSIDLLDSAQEKAATWNKLGNVYRRLNEREQAANAYQKARSLSREKVSSLVARARNSLMCNCQYEPSPASASVGA